MGSDPRALVTGAAGQVGRALRPLLPRGRFLSRTELDVTDAMAVRSAMDGVDLVVHLAALTDVDRCERDPRSAQLVNTVGTAYVVEAARDRGVPVLYVSTDFVFDGEKDEPYAEDDPVRPLNVYGTTKQEGETLVLSLEGGLVVRTSWLIGSGTNFATTVLALAGLDDPLRIVADQIGRPTLCPDLAAALVALIDKRAEGIWHVAGDGPPCTRVELAVEVLSAAGVRADVIPITSLEFAAARTGITAPRPAHAILDLRKAARHGIPLFDWRTSLKRYIAEVV